LGDFNRIVVTTVASLGEARCANVRMVDSYQSFVRSKQDGDAGIDLADSQGYQHRECLYFAMSDVSKSPLVGDVLWSLKGFSEM
jgi:hypothetical protein